MLRENEVMYCMDSVDTNGIPVNKAIYGPDDGRDHRRIDLLYLPCDPVTYKENIVLKQGECFVKDRNDPVEMAAKLQATKDWIGVPDFTMVYNNMRMDLTEFNDKSIRKESRVMNRQFDINFPSWIHGQIYSDRLDDSTTIAGGSKVSYPFKHLKTVGLYSSAWNDFPKKYKFISYQLNIFDSMTIFKRKTMNWQELVGKVGGLMGFIGMFASRVVGYFSAP
jgi:hypothetical protein